LLFLLKLLAHGGTGYQPGTVRRGHGISRRVAAATHGPQLPGG
jgi:hypothetical protein